ncbi:MAG: lysophospholipid acyltransferase family protein [Melioribacteraceae bacterium]|nr:MAG: lysophospholipid acyltransferase family protein [Melioribacteraceae bacterium]
MRLKEIKKRVLSLLGLTVLNFIANLVTKTYRIKIFNETAILKVLNNNEQFISAFWHGRMLIPWYVQRKYKIAALVSRSKDGDILTKLLNNWNYNVVRGSSHIGGKEALKIMEDKIDEGFSFAITPDGPTGPQFKMKPGAVVLAHRKSIPLVLIGTASKKHYVFNSWDKFQVPKAFSKVTVIYSDPIYVNEKSTREEISKLIQDCELELNKLQEEAEQIVNTNN